MYCWVCDFVFFFFQAEDGIRDADVTGVQTCALPISGAKVDDIMIKDVISMAVDEEQEEVARVVARYDLLALPVLDADERLVGIVTHDRSEERRVGKEWRARGAASREKENDGRRGRLM